MRLLIPFLTILLPLSASAQPPEGQDWWACQSLASAGLGWKDQQWKTEGYNHNERFILIAEGDGLSKESVVKAMGSSERSIECRVETVNTYCFNFGSGTSFGFNPNTRAGAIGQIFGGIHIFEPGTDYRDSMLVVPFECVQG